MDRERILPFEEELKAIRPILLQYARRIAHTKEDAEDLLQEAAVRCFQSSTRDKTRALLPYMQRAIVNLHTDKQRRNRYAKMLSLKSFLMYDGDEWHENMLDLPDSRFDPLRLLVEKDFSEHIMQALASINPAFRETLLLIAVGGLSYEEVARLKQVPIGTVRSQIFRARNEFKQKYMCLQFGSKGNVPT